jgi:excisionase family DNA binding protein
MATTLDLTETAFLSPAQTAVVLNVSRETVYRMIRAGQLPSIRVGGQLRVPKRALAARLAETRGGWPLAGRSSL